MSPKPSNIANVQQQIFACHIDEAAQIEPDPIERIRVLRVGVRTLALGAYDIPKFFYAFTPDFRKWPGAVHWIREVGCLLCYGSENPSRKKRKPMKINEMVPKWKAVVVGLAVAHDKDEADKYEASVEDLLTPLLAAPVAQIRQFADLLLFELKNDKSVPYLVWKAFEVYVDDMKKAPDEDVKVLKSDLAKQIVDLVEQDAKDQLPEAMIRALQWRSPQRLEEVKAVVEEEKKAGRKVRLKGRESCLFLEAGGTEERPAVCVQV